MVDRYSYRREIATISHTQYSHSSSHFGGYSSSNSCPSFSSMLLDEICRSIDHQAEDETAAAVYGGDHTAGKKEDDDHANVRPRFKSDEEIITANYYQRANNCIVEKKKARKFRHNSSSASSWDSSCGGGGFFSSSEAESFRSKKFGEITIFNHTDSEISPRVDSRRGFGDRLGQKSNSKLRALTIYGDLKKMKQQPISPGRKLAGFLNSIFTAGNFKKKTATPPAIRGGGDSPSTKSTKTTPSGRKSSGGGAGRKVSFFPIADEEKYDNVTMMKTAIDEEVMVNIMKKSRRVGEAARDFLMNNIYQKKNQMGRRRDQFADHHQSHSMDHLRKNHVDHQLQDFDDEFDAESCASSDLFELENLSAIGMERYREELPVYATTHFGSVVPNMN